MCVFGWLKMVVFRWLGYLFKLFMVIMCVISILWILFALCWFEHFILFMPYLIVICSLLVRCVLHWVWGTFGSLQLINACWSICLVMSPRALMFKVLCSLIIEITVLWINMSYLFHCLFFKLNMVLVLALSFVLLYTTNLLLMVVFIYYALLLWPFLLVYRWPHLLQRRKLLLRKLTKGWKWTITYLGLFNTLRDIKILSWGELLFRKGL